MRFHDRHDHLRYLKMEVFADRIRHQPEVIAQARAHIDRFWRDDPHMADAVATWDKVLAQPAEEIARRLLEDSPEGGYLRETCPPFGAIKAAQVTPLLERLRG